MLLESPNYIRTFSGGYFFPDNVEHLEPNMEDIAHALSSMNRYNGHLQEFYSVAQHSVLVCQEAGALMLEANPSIDSNSFNKFMLQALLHDATEAYMPDMPSPIKRMLPDFQKLENKLQKHIYRYFHLPEETHYIIKQVDRDIRGSEIRCMSKWYEGEDAMGLLITPWTRGEAKRAFLSTYSFIMQGIVNA